jgi:aryl carrier-like protein
LSQQKVSELEDVFNYIIDAVIENPENRMESIEYDVAKIAKKRQPDTSPATPPAIEAQQPPAPKQISNVLDSSSKPMEERLRSLWSKVLRMPGNELEAESQFFEIGGDSIKAMRLVSLARKSGIPLTVKDIFASPGLGQMSTAMASLSPVESRPTAATGTKTFSLIKTDNLQNFIENIICPQISAKPDMIEDIYPATYFQSVCAVNSMKPSRGYNVYFNFDIKGNLDIPRLEKACREVVQTHPILRTVFAIHNNSFLQVVLRKPNFIFSEHDLYDMRDATISTIIDNDKCTPASFGDSNIRFFIFRSSQYPGQYRLTVRILHALYDGLGFPRLWGDINSAYQGQVLKPAPDYASYISLVESRKLEGRSAWTQELAGSSMTRLISRPPSTHHREPISASIISSIPQISFTNLSRHGITFPTLLKASWASVLARHTNTTDVTFGYLTSGRNLPVDNITDLIGPCINLIPIRIQFPPHRKVHDLLHHIHQTHISLLPYETSSFADIVKHCTNWPENTTFSSVVQHQDLEGGIFEDEVSSNGPGLRPTSAVPAPGDHVDCWVTSRPTGKGGMDLEINFAPNSFPRELAERLCKELKETLVMFAANPDGILEVGKEGNKEQPKQPQGCTYQKIGGRKIRMALQETWIEALGMEVGIMEAGCFLRNEMDFFRMGGDSFMALKMVVGLNRRGYKLTVGDVYEDSSFGGMLLRVFEGMEGDGR